MLGDVGDDVVVDHSLLRCKRVQIFHFLAPRKKGSGIFSLLVEKEPGIFSPPGKKNRHGH